VIIYPEEDYWIAQGIQFDVTARGKTPTEASERFNDKFGAELVMSMEIGEEPLSGIGPAPIEFQQMYETATTNTSIVDSAVHLSDGATPHVHQEIKIIDSQRAA
jgi:hypothetical protein